MILKELYFETNQIHFKFVPSWFLLIFDKEFLFLRKRMQHIEEECLYRDHENQKMSWRGPWGPDRTGTIKPEKVCIDRVHENLKRDVLTGTMRTKRGISLQWPWEPEEGCLDRDHENMKMSWQGPWEPEDVLTGTLRTGMEIFWQGLLEPEERQCTL